ncbi:MAG: peptidoglycan bridge formation glycyltransferase FemA/FemB family protein [Candidatus Nomurabacteria bacterium]|nr:MAG: peptidoglycan bridge formation glycyltransferase FemA/FemB family protein [Candidatus Nomurabacteria bacterium]
MDVREISDAVAWDGFIGAQNQAQFLQSWHWGEFQRALGRQIVRLGVFDGARQLAAAQGAIYHLPMNQRYLYIPRGPIMLDYTDKAVWQALHQALLERAQQARALAIRIEPLMLRSAEAPSIVELGYQQTEAMQPADTRLLSLHTSEDDILNAMHQKTRYNIRLAEKKGVQVITTHAEKDLETFLQLQHVTASRDNISPFPDSYFRTMFATLPELMRSIVLAQYNGMTLAANLMIRYGDTMTYSHGASSNEHRNVMAPYLAQWRSIQHAAQSALKWYDFRGIAPSDDPQHAWAGITRFKAGFGGEAVHLIGTYDFPVEKGWYQAYMFGRKLVGLVR